MITALKDAGINFASGLPDTWLRNVIETIEKDPHFTFLHVCNEGVGFSACAGAWLGGKRPVLLMENSGLRVAAEPIARLNLGSGGGGGTHGVGTLIITSYRGDIGDTELWSIGHEITCEPLLQALRVRYTVVRESDQLRTSILRAARAAFTFMSPVAVLISGDLVMKE